MLTLGRVTFIQVPFTPNASVSIDTSIDTGNGSHTHSQVSVLKLPVNKAFCLTFSFFICQTEGRKVDVKLHSQNYPQDQSCWYASNMRL